MKTVVIIGAGASGMMAALTAARSPQNRVLLLERQPRAGRKLAATGNGRCNLTNTGASPEGYRGAKPEFVTPALTAYPPEAVLARFRELGLLTVEEYGGRVYPLSDSANTVLDVLRFALEAAGVELRCDAAVTQLKPLKKGLQVITETDSIYADAVIAACGGAASPKLGGTGSGYELLKAVGHTCTPLTPSLVQLTCDSPYPRALKGVRADAAVLLARGSHVLAESAGEVQFTDTGLSGPAVFDISRAAALQKPGSAFVQLDFVRGCTEQQVYALLAQRRKLCPELMSENLTAGILHGRLGKMVIKYAGLAPNLPLKTLTNAQLAAAAQACKAFALPVSGTAGLENAQVTAGGIRTSEVNPETLESRLVPGLFLCGELLDVDGGCGGYNLQWAWASGMLAGRFGGEEP